MKKQHYAVFIVLAGVIWSISGLWRRELANLPSMLVVTLEHIFRVLFFLPFLPRFFKEYRKMSKKDWLYVSTVAIFSGALATYFFQKALTLVHYIDYSVVILLQQIRPLFAIALAALVLKEKLTKRYGVLAVVGLIAAYFLTFPDYKPQFIGGNGEVMAALLALGAAAMWGSTIVLSKTLLRKFSYGAVACLRFIITIPVALVLTGLLGESYSLQAISPTQWGYLALIGLSFGVISFAFYYKGLQHTEVKVATFAEFSWPVSAAILGYFALGDRLTLVQTLSGIVLVADILILTLKQKQLQ